MVLDSSLASEPLPSSEQEHIGDHPGVSSPPYRGWYKPEGYSAVEGSGKPLWLYNSLTDRKEVFVPHGGPNSKKIFWYSCGPTTYDSAHLGHSRNYMTIDIIRRVLEDYFGYSIMFVMNITDVDDKIVIRARRNYLLKKYLIEITDINQLAYELHLQMKEEAQQAIQQSLQKQAEIVKDAEEQHQEALQAKDTLPEAGAHDKVSTDQLKKKRTRQAEDLLSHLKMEQHKYDSLKRIQDQLTWHQVTGLQSDSDLSEAAQAISRIAGDQLASWLDGKHGSTVTDEAIYRKHAQRYEAEFWQDMDLLGTRRPTVLTRVTEYMKEIVDYVSQIKENGFAYTSSEAQSEQTQANGGSNENLSVYFDTAAFEKSGHMYPKLNPWAQGSTALASDGESNFATSDKKNVRDFALWKASKPGEPSWESPWGRGRPGWHIECSAMASAIIGEKIDIHTGGQDLRFPHHDNELAQAGAYYHRTCGPHCQWVNYFLHSGHLGIDGLKMSKSLKNFISIREALNDFTAVQLRLMFALQPWNKEMTYGVTMKESMRAKEHVFKHFFNNVDVLLRKHTPVLVQHDLEKDLEAKIEEAKQSVDACLRDNINTAGALEALGNLITATNKYMQQREADCAATPEGPSPHPYYIRESAGFVTKILRIFGISSAGIDQMGFGKSTLLATKEQLLDVFKEFRESIASHHEMTQVCSSVNLSEDCDLRRAAPTEILDGLTQFRNEVRICAKKHKLREVLEECDRLRDKTMVELGIRIVDSASGSSVWIAEDPEELKAEARERETEARNADLKKRRKAIEDKKRFLAKAETQAILPTVQASLGQKYSKFDAADQAAYPTHDATGKELSGAELKKARSAADKARKARLFYDTQLREKGPNFLHDLRMEIERALQDLHEGQ